MFEDKKLNKIENFCHSRLAILDLDKRSNQPFIKNNIILIFNGEIYNYKKIKEFLIEKFNYKFDTLSDTECIIALYETMGDEGFKYLSGAFSFILKDKSKKQNRTLFLRDPVGIKPLYFYYSDRDIIASSKLDIITEVLRSMNIQLPKNVRALNDILALGYPRVPIYSNCYEFEPGVLYDNKLNKKRIKFNINKNKTFKDAILERYVTSDRPVGITLSGGIDSGYIAFECAKYCKKNKLPKIHTFTVGFFKNDDDVVTARKFAKEIDSIHHEIIVSKTDYEEYLYDGLDRIGFQCELGSVAHTNILAREISKFDIKVIIAGDGSDEIQGGYKRHSETNGMRTAELWEWYKKRIIKNDLSVRKKILEEDFCLIEFDDSKYPNNANIMLHCDYKNELRFYHIKRLEHIFSSYGLEIRFPYMDYSIVRKTFETNFSKKVNSRGNKLLLRDFALEQGLPKEYAFRPKIPLKDKKLNVKEHILKIYKKRGL